MKRTLLTATIAFVLIGASQNAARAVDAVPAAMPSPQAAPSAAPLIVPPTGWIHKDVPMQLGPWTSTGLWLPPVHIEEGINTGSMVTGGATLDAFVPQMKKGLELVGGAGSVKVWHAVKLCNGSEDGWYGESTLTMGSATLHQDLVFTLTNQQGFSATYTRALNVPEDATANAAILSLCTAKDVTPNASQAMTRVSAYPNGSPQTRAREWFDRMTVGDVDPTQLTLAMNKALTADVVRNVGAQLRALGSPSRYALLDTLTKDGETAYAYRVEFPSTTIREIITITSAGKIDGLFFQPTHL